MLANLRTNSKLQSLVAIVAGIVFALVVLFFTTDVFATSDKVNICHRTASQQNPYILNNPSKDGDVSGHDDHNGPVWPLVGQDGKWGDIIPPFDYTPSWCHSGWCQNISHYNGQNWNTAGQAIYNNNCNMPQPTVTPTNEPQPTATPSPTLQPTVTPTPTEEVTVTPTVEPRVTPVESPRTGGNEQSGANVPSSTTAPSCSDLQPAEMVQDGWYTDYKPDTLNPGLWQLDWHWSTNHLYDRVHIVYGQYISQWEHALLGTPNDGVETIHGLQKHSYWFQTAYVRGCAVGPYSHPVDP